MTDYHTEHTPTLILASESPRRAELLRQINVPFTSMLVDIDETRRSNEAITDYVERMATEKVKFAWKKQSVNCYTLTHHVILSADTCGEIDGELLGKPKDFDDAKRFLGILSGNTHEIHTAFALFNGENLHVENVTSSVQFDTITPQQMENYWVTGEPCDKAGAYAIQGIGAQFVTHLKGSYSAVMGLPLFELSRALPLFKIRTL